MRVVKFSTLKKYWEQPDFADAEQSLRAWFRQVQHAEWKNHNDLRREIGTADPVGDCVVFNIKGNAFRLITRIRYPTFVFVLALMTHKVYDKKLWHVDCGCFDKPKKRKKGTK